MSIGQHPLPVAQQPQLEVYVVSPTGKKLRIGGGKAMAFFRAMERFIGQPGMAGEITIAVNNGGIAQVTGKESFR